MESRHGRRPQNWVRRRDHPHEFYGRVPQPAMIFDSERHDSAASVFNTLVLLGETRSDAVVQSRPSRQRFDRQGAADREVDVQRSSDERREDHQVHPRKRMAFLGSWQHLFDENDAVALVLRPVFEDGGGVVVAAHEPAANWTASCVNAFNVKGLSASRSVRALVTAGPDTAWLIEEQSKANRDAELGVGETVQRSRWHS